MPSTQRIGGPRPFLEDLERQKGFLISPQMEGYSNLYAANPHLQKSGYNILMHLLVVVQASADVLQIKLHLDALRSVIVECRS